MAGQVTLTTPCMRVGVVNTNKRKYSEEAIAKINADQAKRLSVFNVDSFDKSSAGAYSFEMYKIKKNREVSIWI